MITPDTIDKIMDTTRIEEVVGEFVRLKKRGVNLIGLCPFHNEKTPSFTVSAPKGIYKCFGCGKGGNAVNFLMEHEHFTYPEALRYLASKYQIEIEEEKPSPEQQQVAEEKESLFNLSAFAQKYFHEQLFESEEGKSVGLTYLKERGFSLESIRRFGVGYSPNQWDAFTQTALSQGYKKEFLIKTSLSKSKDQQLYDTFRGRIIFPIHNLSGRILGFGGRILSDHLKQPKYVNSAESDIYHKSRALYGIHFAKSAMSAQDNCFLVEGYTDVISMHQAGIENVIASSGTALTTEQIKLIRRYTANVCLLFDSDTAGIKAAFRSIDMILEEGLNVRIVLFPEGEDPDSFARSKRPLELTSFLEEQAVDFITFKTKLLLSETRDDPIRKAGLIREIAQSISLIPEPIARSLYVRRCSQAMEVEEKLLFNEINKQRRDRYTRQRQPLGTEPPPPLPPPQPLDQETTEATPGNGAQERELIRLLLHHGEELILFEIGQEDKRPQEVSIRVMDFVTQDIEEDRLVFDNEACRIIYETFLQAAAENTLPKPQVFFHHENAAVRELAIDLLTSPYVLSKNWETKHRIYVKQDKDNLRKHVLHVVYSFKLRKLEVMIDQNQRQLKHETDPTRLQELLTTNHRLTQSRSRFASELSRIVTR